MFRFLLTYVKQHFVRAVGVVASLFSLSVVFILRCCEIFNSNVRQTKLMNAPSPP